MFKHIAAGTALAFTLAAAPAMAGAIHDANLYTGNTLAANDDGSTGRINIGFDINFYGQNFSQLYVNNNGNVTFNAAMSTFTPFSLLSTQTPMLAPFFADVDTRNAASGLTQYGQATVDGHKTFGVNWINVGYYATQADKTNSFQLIVTDRSDTGAATSTSSSTTTKSSGKPAAPAAVRMALAARPHVLVGPTARPTLLSSQALRSTVPCSTRAPTP